MIAREIGHFLVGVMFLTRLPVPSELHHVEGRLARAARYFPLVGILVGLITGGVFLLTMQILDPYLAAACAVTVGMLITGALHEDGLADTADGLGGGQTREHALEIMRDSRLGTYGACALFASIGFRILALGVLDPAEGFLALVIAHTVSRALIPTVLVSGAYARTRGLASSVAEGVGTVEIAFAIITAFVVSMIGGYVAGLASCAAAVVCGGIMLAILMRRLGGYTGDGLGAVQQVGEIAVLVVLSGLWL
ncbi:MAG: adenosylcobinamide-GDP ribazoletransferase [Pseudomonadota bacterium]